MADLGSGVSYVYDNEGYNYDMVVFQKEKPPLDSELNLAQELQNVIAQRNLRSLSSGWLSINTPYADRSLAPSSTSDLKNKFYTQNPSGAKPEFALVNGQVIYVTNTASTTDNANLIDLGDPPTTGNRVNGVFLEAWRALIDPSLAAHKPDPATIIDTLNEIFMIDSNHGWICGTNGLILRTTNGGATWPVISIETKRSLNAVHFYNLSLGWVVGDNGVVARSSSGGAAWSLLTESTTVNLKSVHAVSQTVVWAVGENGVILKASNGVTFVPVTSGVTNNLNKVYFSDSNNGWIVGDGGLILVTKNGGVTWTASSSGTTEILNSVYFYNSNFGFAVGDNGVILQSSNGGVTWINQSGYVTGGAVTTNLLDVNMFPKLDEAVVGEEVSSQLGATGNSFTIMHTPITGADRKGVITNNPADVIVTVNGTAVIVLSVNGSTGKVILAAAPGLGAVTKIDYFYQANCAVFQGKAWIVGDKGTVLFTDTIGSSWTAQTSGTGYDLKAVSFISQTTGWLCGASSVIRTTSNGGTTWTQQTSDIFARQIQRIYNEGNVLTDIFLDENSIHPDAQIETTKRVQVQYRIRVIEAVDPLSHPEAGLNSAITGFGPNSSTTGSFPYENMGPINGDYGCWRARCVNTVDGYVYAIPMFFVNRRNTEAYSSSNPNGQHIKNSSQIRPDLLLATNVVPSDILDVRRKIVIPSTEELFYNTFDALSANTLRTNFGRGLTGDQYGTELLFVDTIDSTHMAELVAGTISSESSVVSRENPQTASGTVPTSYSLPPLNGIFHPDPAHYSAKYVSATNLQNDQKSIPGIFYQPGTSAVSFYFNPLALTNSSVDSYDLAGDFIADSSVGLTYAPVDPQLVINKGTSNSVIYHGVLDTTEGRIIESWDSGITGYQNFALAYSTQDATNQAQMAKASPVELHRFMRITSANLSSGKLIVPRDTTADAESPSIPYTIFTIKQINNKTSGFSHKIKDVTPGSSILVEPVPGYEFITGTVLEIVGAVESNTVNANIRNGAAVNFNSGLRSVNSFSKSVFVSTSVSLGQATFTQTNQILGWSSCDATGGLTQAVCWDYAGSTFLGMREVDTSRSASLLKLIVTGPLVGDTAKIQLLVKETALQYPTNTVEIAYKYVPSQGQVLPSALTVVPVSTPIYMYVSNKGSGGGDAGEPFELPLEHIPVNKGTILNDKRFSNFVQLKFANYMISGGFAQKPITVPGSFFGSSITLSSPTVDALNRTFYSGCSKEFSFATEGLQLAVPRKIYVPVLARVTTSNSLYLAGEYVMLIFSRPVLTETENKTGYFPNGDCSISVYRISNRPISRV